MKSMIDLPGIRLAGRFLVALAFFLATIPNLKAQIGNPIPGVNNGYTSQWCNVQYEPSPLDSEPDGPKKFTGGTLEVAIDIDYSLYAQYNGDQNKLDSVVNYHMSIVNEFYRNKLDITVVVVFTHYWNSPTPWYGIKADYERFLLISRYWQNYHSCIHRDLAIVLTAEALPGPAKGLSTSQICNDSRYEYGYATINVKNPGDWVAIAHEIGHNLGAVHTDGVGCNGICSNCTLMCSSFSCLLASPTANQVNIDNCNMVRIKDRLDKLKNLCYTCIDSIIQPHGNSTCESCLESIKMTVSTDIVDKVCYPNDTVVITVNACGRCHDNSMKRITIGIGKLDLLTVVDYGAFTWNQQKEYFYIDDPLANGDCKEFSLKIKMRTTGNFTFQPNITFGCNNQTVSDLPRTIRVRQFPFWNNTGVINGGRLSDLIREGKMPGYSEGYANTSTKIIGINGDLIVDTFDILNNFNITMSEGSKILISNNGSLGLLGCNINSCTKMWKGIEVEEGGSLTTGKERFSIAPILPTVIRDAEHAINLLPFSTATLEDCSFINNYIGLNIGFLSTLQDYFIVQLNKMSFLSFDSDANLLPPYLGQSTLPLARPFCGIQLTNVPFIAIKGCGFKNITNGIISKNSSMSVNNCNFADLLSLPYPVKQTGIYAEGNYNRLYSSAAVDFTNCYNGVNTNGMQLQCKNMTFNKVNFGVSSILNDKSIFELEDNTMTNIQEVGIFAFRKGAVKSKINNNNITVNALTPSLLKDPFGIVLLSQSTTKAGWKANNNTVYVDKGKGGIYAGLGYQDSLVGNKVFRRTEVSPFRGIQIYGTNNSYLGNNSVKNTKVPNFDIKGFLCSGLNNGRLRCNRADTLGTGLEMNALNNFTYLTTTQLHGSGRKALYYERGTVIGQQISQGNRWFGQDCWAYNNSIDFANTSSQLINSHLSDQQFQYKDDFPPYWYPFAITDLPADVIVDWFQEIGGTDATCSNPPSGFTTLEELERKRQAIDIKNISALSGHPLWNQNTKWTAQSRLYDMLYTNSNEFGYDESLLGFMNSASPHALGAYAAIRRWINTPPAISEIAFSTNQGNTDLVWNQLSTLDSIQGTLSEPDTAIGHQQHAQQQSLANLAVQLDAQANAAQTIVHQDAVALLTQNDLLVDSTIAQTNEKAINAVAIAFIGSNSTTMDQNQLQIVAEIASQCPIVGGDAVYRARTMIGTQFPSYIFDDAKICSEEISTPRSKQGKEEGNGAIIVIPNPSNGTFEVKNLLANAGKELAIITMTGTTVHQVVIPEGSNSLVLQLENKLQPGIYNIVVKSDKKLIKTTKLVVLK